MSRVYISRPVEARFWERVNKQGPLKVKSLGRCWEWTGSTKGRVYGQIKDDNGKVESAHRVAYRLQHKRSPGKKHVLHRCDNPVCVRGSHLFLGTNKDNIEDRVRKGRSLHGERHHLAKITEAVVHRIDVLIAEGLSQRAVASVIGLGQQQVSLIHTRKRWAHVPKLSA